MELSPVRRETALTQSRNANFGGSSSHYDAGLKSRVLTGLGEEAMQRRRACMSPGELPGKGWAP